MSNPDGQGPLIGIVAGEESGQLLAAGLIEALETRLGTGVRLVGVGGKPLADKGLQSLFDPQEIALMGVSAVVAALPRLIRRIGQTADALVAARPDALILVDSPDFSLRVAKRVKARLPDLPVIKYVAPTVWAWRPERAKAMTDYVDRVLAILPFEPAVMDELGGPETLYVGHRLMADEGLTRCWEAHQSPPANERDDDAINLLILPGSRRSEVRALMDDFQATAELLLARGNRLSIALPTLPHLERWVRDHVLGWSQPVAVSVGRDAQIAALATADVALAASGTVTLELALAGVPAISCYRSDLPIRLVSRLITAWSAALPNVIADRAVINEYYDAQIRPGMLARLVEELADAQSARRAMTLDGYAEVRQRMAVDAPPSETAAAVVADLLGRS